MVDFRKLLERRQRAHDRFDQGREALPINRNVRITFFGNDYSIRFDRELLPVFKNAVPDHDRRWLPDRKVWLVHPDSIDLAKTAFEQYTQTTIVIPEIPKTDPQKLSRTFLLEYLGVTKNRGSRKSAYGYTHGDWSAEFPEDVLRAFFEGGERGKPTGKLQTLYQVLFIPETAEPEAIKSAWRRLARQWHTDVCKEPEAEEMIRKINAAHEVLIDPHKKARYDAGLYFERQGNDQSQKPDYSINRYGYRAPLRCGSVTAIGTARLMRFVVDEIITWEDVVNAEGKTMVSQWPAGADAFQVLWV